MSRRIIVLGGTGAWRYVGSYMCPSSQATLPTLSYASAVGKAEPYPASSDTTNWAKVQRVTLDRQPDDVAVV